MATVPAGGPGPARRVALACGIVGPAAFVGAWLVAGALRSPDYSPARQAISQLARSGTTTRPLMTAGFIVFGVLVPVYAVELDRGLGSRRAAAAAVVSGLATLAVAALPLSAAGGRRIDTWHAVAAGTGYAAQVLAPLLAAPALRPTARVVSRAVSATALVCLVGSVLLPDLTGLLQRAGLTVVDAWYAAVAVALLRRPATGRTGRGRPPSGTT